MGPGHILHTLHTHTIHLDMLLAQHYFLLVLAWQLARHSGAAAIGVVVGVAVETHLQLITTTLITLIRTPITIGQAIKTAQAIGNQINNAVMPILVVVAQIAMQNVINFARIYSAMASAAEPMASRSAATPSTPAT